MQSNIEKPLKLLNAAVFLQQQRYLLPVSFLFYLYNGLTLADFIFFQSIFYFVCLIAEVPAGYLGDIFKRKNVLIFSYILFLLRIILWIFFRGYYIVLFGEILYGLSKAFYRGVSDGYIYDYLKTKNIPQNMLNKYGRYNFFMSLGCALSAVIGVLLYKYFGFKILLSMEFIIHTGAILLLFLIPQITHETIKSNSFLNHVKAILNTAKRTITNLNINREILYCSILTGVTSLFVWNFQPLMKSANVAVILFGVIFFINHILRALFSLNSYKITNKIGIKKLGFFVFPLYIVSFLIILFNQIYANNIICFISLLFICCAIGLYMAYSVAVTSLIHKYAPNQTRSTMSSVNNMLAGFFSGLFLMVYKCLITHFPISIVFLFFTISFIFVIFIIFYKKE